MVAIRVKTFVDMQNAVLRRNRQPITTSTNANAQVIEEVKGFLNLRYQLVCAEEKWRWRRKQRSLTIVSKYTTGDVDVTNGSRLVTFNAAAITSQFLNRRFRVAGENTFYDIVAVDVVAQTAMLSTLYVGADAAATGYVIFKDKYGLWPDVEELDDTMNLERPYGQPRAVGPRKIQQLINMNPSREGKVRAYSIDGSTGFDNVTMGEFLMGYDFIGGNTLQTKNLVVYPPIADEDHIIPVTYIQRADPLDADDDEPLMAIEDRQLLVFGALADLFETQTNDQAFTIWQTMYDNHINKMKADFQDTDDMARLVVEDNYHRNGEILHPAFGDLGQIFDDVDF